jgi:hypothetical protein
VFCGDLFSCPARESLHPCANVVQHDCSLPHVSFLRSPVRAVAARFSSRPRRALVLTAVFLFVFFVWLTVFPLQAQVFTAERWSQFLLVQRAARSCSNSVAQSPGKGVRAPALSSISPAQANGSSPRFHCSRSELFDFCSGCVSNCCRNSCRLCS